MALQGQRLESTRPSSPALLASRMRFPLLSLPSSPSKGHAGRPCSDPSTLIQGSGCWLALDDSRHSVPAPGQQGTTRELRKPTPSSSTPALSVTVAVSKTASTLSDALDATLWRYEPADCKPRLLKVSPGLPLSGINNLS